jgi:hypothetical protein
MKLSVFILLAVSINSFGQVDSIARIRKPVLECLIAGHYTAGKLTIENSILRNQQNELLTQIDFYKKINASHRKDSVLCDSAVALTRGIANTWKESYEAEKRNHKATKRQVKKWKAVGIGTTLISILIWIL